VAHAGRRLVPDARRSMGNSRWPMHARNSRRFHTGSGAERAVARVFQHALLSDTHALHEPEAGRCATVQACEGLVGIAPFVESMPAPRNITALTMEHHSVVFEMTPIWGASCSNATA